MYYLSIADLVLFYYYNIAMSIYFFKKMFEKIFFKSQIIFYPLGAEGKDLRACIFSCMKVLDFRWQID